MHVHPDHRRRGHGTAVVEHLTARAADAGRTLLDGEVGRAYDVGLAVKVADLRLLQGARTDGARLSTYNAEVNEHMVEVNEALGFRPVERLAEFSRKLTAEG